MSKTRHIDSEDFDDYDTDINDLISQKELAKLNKQLRNCRHKREICDSYEPERKSKNRT
jgi:hypothetical protein